MASTQSNEHTDIRERLRFLGINDAVRDTLSKAKGLFATVLPGAVDTFYTALRSHSNLVGMFSDPSRMKVAREAQIKHWMTLFSGHFNQDYIDSVTRIGRTHSRIGLEPRWYLGAYAIVKSELDKECVKAFWKPGKNSETQEGLGTLLRAISLVVALDTDLVIAIYLEENDSKHRESMNVLSGTFQSSVQKIITDATKDLQSFADRMTESAGDTAQRSAAVSVTMEQSYRNVQSVASAAGELSRSIDAIRTQSHQSSDISHRAVEQARRTGETTKDLSQAVAKISDVIKLINDIADRTNILAINASIQAARAGDAGKGFSVVASEVRNLAGQTVQATDAIAAHIQQIQSATLQTSEAMTNIAGIIDQINKATNVIATAIEEQGVVTQEIANNAQEAAKGTTDTAQNMTVVSRSAKETGAAAESVGQSMTKLKDEFTELNKRVEEFLLKLR